jgi:hypothetical protein
MEHPWPIDIDKKGGSVALRYNTLSGDVTWDEQ